MAPSAVTLRVGEETMVIAAAGAQSGRKLPSVSATVAIAITKDENEAVTLEDGVLTAVAAGTAEITAESAIAGIAGKLTVTVTKPIDEIVFTMGDADAPSDINLAAGESTGEITATAHDEDGEVIEPRSDWSWSSSDGSVASVAQTKDEDDELVDGGAHATITGKGSGDADITATVEGVSGSIAVNVTGQSITRVIDPSSSSNGNALVYDRGKTGGEGWTTPDVTTDDATTVFDVDLRDVASNALITSWTLGVSPGTAVAGDATNDPMVGAAAAAANEDGTVTVTITATAPDAAVMADTYETFVSLTATGAREARLRFTITVIDAPE